MEANAVCVVPPAPGCHAGCASFKLWFMVVSCFSETDKSEGLEHSLEFGGDVGS